MFSKPEIYDDRKHFLLICVFTAGHNYVFYLRHTNMCQIVGKKRKIMVIRQMR